MSTLNKQYPMYVASRPERPNSDLVVTDKYTQKPATRVAAPDGDAVERAIEGAVSATAPMRRLKPYQRQAVLYHCVEQFEKRFDELTEALCVEAGKPVQHARGEVTRLIDTFRIAAEEAVRIYGEVQPMEISARASGRFGMWKRVPIGPCGFITPFNFPLNLVAHKVAPALAVGCPWVLKPARNTPIGALIIAEVLAETDLPEGAFSVLPADNQTASPIVEDDRIKLLSFTGSDTVGWKLKANAGKKKVHLELGGNAACIVHNDVDLDDVVERCRLGVFYQSGQSCISVQRLYIHDDVYETFRDRMVQATKGLKVGNPMEADTFVGPIISEKDAERIVQWVAEAKSNGATVLCGGERDGAVVQPTLLEDAQVTDKVNCEEVFGPVGVLYRYHDYEQALNHANNSDYGLQAGVFTRDIYRIHQAWDELDVGGVLINDVPSWRVDHMPYGGVKDSGLGREGVRWAIAEMTEVRLLLLRGV
jgi:acyl-CoA reductase-like NAD-dependent aldehyde dehydrogenase